MYVLWSVCHFFWLDLQPRVSLATWDVKTSLEAGSKKLSVRDFLTQRSGQS